MHLAVYIVSTSNSLIPATTKMVCLLCFPGRLLSSETAGVYSIHYMYKHIYRISPLLVKFLQDDRKIKIVSRDQSGMTIFDLKF
jgi:hypothetical protein